MVNQVDHIHWEKCGFQNFKSLPWQRGAPHYLLYKHLFLQHHLALVIIYFWAPAHSMKSRISSSDPSTSFLPSQLSFLHRFASSLFYAQIDWLELGFALLVWDYFQVDFLEVLFVFPVLFIQPPPGKIGRKIGWAQLYWDGKQSRLYSFVQLAHNVFRF